MLSEFSGGYYSLEMQVQPYSDGPVIEADLYDFIEREVYSQTDAPITMKLSLDNGVYFAVERENAVPPSVLALPESWASNFEKEGKQTVFVLKPGYSHIINT